MSAAGNVTPIAGGADKATLRDQFAMAALTGLLASPRAPVAAEGNIDSSPENVARLASLVADAMLAERAKREGGQ